MNRLVDLRTVYLRTYQNRNFSPTAESNQEYQELLDHLNDERLEEFRVRAAEQARTAVAGQREILQRKAGNVKCFSYHQ